MYLLAYAIASLFTYFSSPNEYDDSRRLALENEGMFGGDMFVNEKTFKNGKVDVRFRWPGYPGGGNIPYVIDSSLAAQENLIKAAMKQYHDNTCIRFVPRTNEPEYVRIFKGVGCSSVVGRDKSRQQPQPLSLGSTCWNIGTIVHELGHTVGLIHEQNRSDRDTYLNVYLQNVKRANVKNFQKFPASQNILLNDFDTESIMIYSNYAFSKNGKKTMEAKNGRKLTNPYAKTGLNKSDIDRVNKLYMCR